MTLIKHMFSIYIVLVMLGIGLYMVCVQGKNLKEVDHFNKESKFVKCMGWFYLVLSGVGFIVLFI